MIAPAIHRHRRIPTRSALAAERLPVARSLLARCSLCFHRCATDRLSGPSGLCHAGDQARVFAAQTDVSDEMELLPSFAISLSGCNLRCDFCITGAPSWNPRAGNPLAPHGLREQAERAVARGAKHIMILGGEPTIHLPALLELIAALPDTAPIVLKTNACFTEDVRTLLAGLVNVWLPDFKFGNPDCAHRLAGIPPSTDYRTTVTNNLLWMAAQEASSDLIVRHLIMPGHVDCCWQPVAQWLAIHLPDVKVSLRSGYWPAWHSTRHRELRIPLPQSDLNRALAIARDHDLTLVT